MATPQGFDTPFRMFKQGCSPNVVEGDDVFDRSIRTIIQTFPGERPYRPSFGCYAKAMIFQNMSEAAAIQTGDEIQRAVGEWEPRVSIDSVQFELEESTILLTINWRANGQAQDSTTTIPFRT